MNCRNLNVMLRSLTQAALVLVSTWFHASSLPCCIDTFLLP